MIYTEIVDNLHPLHSSWEKLKVAVKRLAEVLPEHSADFQELQATRIEPGIKRIREVTTAIQKASSPSQALSHAASFLTNDAAVGSDEALNLETRLGAHWDLINDRLTPEQQQKAEVFAVRDLIEQIGTDRVASLQNITQLQTDSLGIAAASVRRAIADAEESVTDAIQDVTTYPVLTQEVGYTPSPLATGGGSGGATTNNLGMTATKAINDVLGWKMKADDPKGFVGALNASFCCQEVEGRTECTWTPRTYAVATDLAGGITGAQASLYTRAKEALDLSLPILDALYALDPTADAEEVDALKKVARSQMTELVNELGMMCGPRPFRVSQYFDLLLAVGFPLFPNQVVTHDPDNIGGTLGRLREVLGLNSHTDDFVNSVDDEQDLTNYRILADYMTSLAQSWVNNLRFFMTPTPAGTQPFFGTQLVLLSRQLSVIAESVDEVRFAMDSVFIGPSERQTLPITTTVASNKPYTIYAEDLLSWIYSFATQEGPQLVQDGGKYAVGEAFAKQANNLQLMVNGAQNPGNQTDLPPAYFTSRVQTAWRELGLQLKALVNLANPISHKIVPTVIREVHPLVTDLSQATTFDNLHEALKKNVFVKDLGDLHLHSVVPAETVVEKA
jgi:hypothetical protein